MQFHWLRARAICHPTEDPAKVRSAMALGLELEVTETPVATHHGAAMLILEAEVRRNKDIRGFLAALPDDVRARVASSLEARLDDGVLHLRFDKQEAYRGAVVLGHSDPVAIRIRARVHPSTESAHLSAWREHLAPDAPTAPF